MTGLKGATVLTLVLAAAGSSVAAAQIPGMPLFTNPRYGTGLRVHADLGQPTEDGTGLGDRTVLQGGVTFALGPVGLGVNVASVQADASSIQACTSNPTFSCGNKKITASALGQIRIAGGGMSNVSLSVFGGASADFTGWDAASGTNSLEAPRELTIPVGIAVGLRIPLGLASLNLWGAPRMNMFKFINCPSGSTACDETESNFRWAAGADLPVFRLLSIRAAYDSGKIGNETISYWGIGASIGIGGMR